MKKICDCKTTAWFWNRLNNAMAPDLQLLFVKPIFRANLIQYMEGSLNRMDQKVFFNQIANCLNDEKYQYLPSAYEFQFEISIFFPEYMTSEETLQYVFGIIYRNWYDKMNMIYHSSRQCLLLHDIDALQVQKIITRHHLPPLVILSNGNRLIVEHQYPIHFSMQIECMFDIVHLELNERVACSMPMVDWNQMSPKNQLAIYFPDCILQVVSAFYNLNFLDFFHHFIHVNQKKFIRKLF
jgi:hypothetical protein